MQERFLRRAIAAIFRTPFNGKNLFQAFAGWTDAAVQKFQEIYISIASLSMWRVFTRDRGFMAARKKKEQNNHAGVSAVHIFQVESVKKKSNRLSRAFNTLTFVCYSCWNPHPFIYVYKEALQFVLPCENKSCTRYLYIECISWYI